MLNYLKYLGYVIGSILIGVILITIVNYFGIINSTVSDIMKIVLVVISTFVSAYFLGKISKSKGYLEGAKLGLLLILILVIGSLILGTKFKISILIYYLIILFTSIFGSMVGINRKKDD